MISRKTKKARLLEAVVAAMHKGQGVTVQKNVRLPSTSETKRRREIDVLVTSIVAGYTVSFAIECKNYENRIGAPIIDGFVGKLQDVGIPTQMGIVVSVKGFTKGAISRAKEAGIKTLTLAGLNDDRLSSMLMGAIQSVVHLLPFVTKVTLTNNVKNISTTEDLAFYNRSGEFKGTVFDLIWWMWLNGRIEPVIGKHDLEIELPTEWVQIINGQIEKPIAVAVDIFIRGYAITLFGTATNHMLVNSASSTLEKVNTQAKFENNQDRYSLEQFDSEDELEHYWSNREEPIKLLSRMMLPRIKRGDIFWPPSQRVRQIVEDFVQKQENVQVDKAQIEQLLRGIEGDDLKSVWDPI